MNSCRPNGSHLSPDFLFVFLKMYSIFSEIGTHIHLKVLGKSYGYFPGILEKTAI